MRLDCSKPHPLYWQHCVSGLTYCLQVISDLSRVHVSRLLRLLGIGRLPSWMPFDVAPDAWLYLDLRLLTAQQIVNCFPHILSCKQKLCQAHLAELVTLNETRERKSTFVKIRHFTLWGQNIDTASSYARMSLSKRAWIWAILHSCIAAS